ncbi:DUF6053 domain-containing protein [Lysobacter enzymogenes]
MRRPARCGPSLFRGCGNLGFDAGPLSVGGPSGPMLFAQVAAT